MSSLWVAISAAAALLALAAFSPGAFAQTIDLSPDTANNPPGTEHTVTATTTGGGGFCSATNLNSGAACSSDPDCDATVLDDGAGTCETSGGFVFFVVLSGPNSGTTGSGYTSGGVATFTYTGSGGAGTDTISACLDADPLDFGFLPDDSDYSGCASGVGGEGDFLSDTVEKIWGGTVTLTPETAANPFGTDHTVTATIGAVSPWCSGDAGQSCTTDADCSVGSCDLAGRAIFFQVTGVNPQEAILFTDSSGVAALTYSDTNGVGLDSIQACGDFDSSPGTHDEISDAFSDCAADAGGRFDEFGIDVLSNVVTKRWDPVVTLTPPFDFNPVGGCHKVDATVTGARKICTSTFLGLLDYAFCDTDSDCGLGVCSLAGYPVFFAILDSCQGGPNSGKACTTNTDCAGYTCGGPNVGDLGSAVTNAGGVASKAYCDTEDGEDLVKACGDLDPNDLGSLPDDSDFASCVSDYPDEVDIPSNTVTKDWLENFVTGGAGAPAVQLVKKQKLQFSGNVGKLNGLNLGQWNEIAEDNGATFHCHWNSFTSIVFFGPAATNPTSTHNSVTFTTGPGICSDGTTPTETVTIVDNGEGKKAPRDTINVTSSDLRLVTGGAKAAVTGNFQVHSQ